MCGPHFSPRAGGFGETSPEILWFIVHQQNGYDGYPDRYPWVPHFSAQMVLIGFSERL